AVLFTELASLDLLVQRLLEAGQHRFAGRLLTTAQDHLVAGSSGHLGDTRSHDPRAHDSQSLDRHGRSGYRRVDKSLQPGPSVSVHPMPAHDLHVAVLDRLSGPIEDHGLADRRRRLLAWARGRVLDVGTGTGANLAHYRDVDGVVALEPEPAARRRLEERL